MLLNEFRVEYKVESDKNYVILKFFFGIGSVECF